MGKSSFGIAFALIFALPVSVQAKGRELAGVTRTAPWNSETSDLEADSRIIYGKLPNGLRYAIRRNERPQNQVLIRMTLDFGSAAEADDEQGLAHQLATPAPSTSSTFPRRTPH